MAVGSGGEFRADFREVRRAMNEMIDAKYALNAMDPRKGVRGYTAAGTRMERSLRKETRIMGERVIIPALQQAASTKFEREIVKTARAVNDRLPIVKVGKTQPKTLAGWKYVKQGYRGLMKGTLAYGSEYGPKGGARKGKQANQGVNYYGRPRKESGYWVTPTMASARVTRGIIQGYAAVVNEVFKVYGVNKKVGG